MTKPKIGLALGSGSARGWAHIGVIRALKEAGIEPDVVCGASIGALVGAAYVSDNLAALDEWVRKLAWWDVVKFMDVRLTGGGFIEGSRLMELFESKFEDSQIESLPRPFAAVATDLNSGREVWIQQGSLLQAVRASIALPGLFTPARVDGSWLLDGGLTNPVPVSVCRALGAELIIAVNLNGDIVGKHLDNSSHAHNPAPVEGDLFKRLLARVTGGAQAPDSQIAAPGLFDVLAGSLNIMQDRITRSRMAGDPPDVLITPRLAHVGLLEFDRAEEAIEEGYTTTKHTLPAISHILKEPPLPV